MKPQINGLRFSIFLLLVIGLVFSQSIRAEIDLMGLIMDVKQSRGDA